MEPGTGDLKLIKFRFIIEIISLKVYFRIFYVLSSFIIDLFDIIHS